MKKLYIQPNFTETTLRPKTKNGLSKNTFTTITNFMSKNSVSFLLACLLFFGGKAFGQTIFSENIGTPTGTTSIATYATGTVPATFQNKATLTYSSGSATNPADVRISSVSSTYSGASGNGNIFFTSTNAQYGFAIETIDASSYTSLTLDYGYRKESATLHATFAVEYWNGTAWISIASTAATLFNEATSATAGWYSAKQLSLPVGAQISGLKIRFLKSGANSIRIDDIILKGTPTSSYSGVTAGAGAEPATLPSTTTTLTGAVAPQTNAILNFDFLVTDDANTASGNDALPTLINNIVIPQGTGNDITDWTQGIQGVELSDGTNTLTGTIAATTITFSSINTATLGNIADGATKTYTLKIWLKTALGGTLPTTIDGLNFAFKIDRTNFTTASSATSTQFESAAGTVVESGSTNNAVAVVATKLNFVQNPTNVNQNSTMSPSVTISATDPNENRDLNYTANILLSSTGTMTGDPITVAAVAGLATYSGVVHTVAGTGFTLSGTSGALTATGASSAFNVIALTPIINVTSQAHNSNYAYGSKEWNSNTDQIFTINNTGTATMAISSLSFSGTGFTLQGAAPTSIAAGGNATFTVRFTPNAIGAFTGSVTINNNSSNQTAYVINFTGTGTPNILSTITTDATYSYTSDIPYATFQSTPVPVSAASSVGVHNIIITDGTDADNLPTILNALSYTYTGTANTIRAAALFTTTNTKIADATTVGANSIAFTGLSGANVTAPDGSTIQMILRVTFTTTVTDNDKLVFTVSSATAAASSTSSLFASFGAVSDNGANNRNRIEVTATKLAFVQQPTTTSISTTMAPSPTVRALDANNILDLDYTSNISITSTGTMTGDPIAVAASAGVATFSSVIHTAVGTGLTLTASSGALTGITSGTFNITTIVFANGDYRSTGSGNWLSNNATPAIWERLVAGVWTTSNSPTYATANSVFIQNGHTITSGGSWGNSVNLKILSGGTFNANHPGTTNSVYIYDGGTLNINASMQNNNAFDVEDNAVVNINNLSTNASAIWNGTENFRPNSIFNIYEWGANTATTASRPLFNGSNVTTNTYNGYTAAFGNINVDLSGSTQPNTFVFLSSGVTANLAHKDVYLYNPASTRNIAFLGTGTATSGIGGDFTMDDLFSFSNLVIFATSGNLTFTIKGNMQLDGATTVVTTSSTAGTSTSVTVEGDINITPSGVFDFSTTVAGGSPPPQGIINLKGDLTVAGSGLLRNSNTSTLGNFNFTGTGDGTTAALTQTIDIASTSVNENRNINFNVKSGAYVRLINRDFELGTNSGVYVESGGVFDFGFNGTIPLNVVISGSQTGTVFQSLQGSTLKISSVDGIATTGITNNVRTVASNRSFNQVATFHYIGKANQVTGNGITTGASAKVIICDLIDNNTQLSFTDSTGITSTNTISTTGGKLDIRRGQVIESTTAFIYGSTGTLYMAPGTLYKVMKGYAVNTDETGFSGGTFIPRMLGATYPYVLTGGTIELGGNTVGNYFQTLRGTVGSRPNYKSVKFSGTNAYNSGSKTATNFKNLSSNTTIDSSLTITDDAIVDCIGATGSTQTFVGEGGLVMSGTNSRIRFKKLNSAQPELDGNNIAYSLTSGTVEFYGSGATEQQQLRGNYRTILTPVKINYNNIDINATAANLQTFATTPTPTNLQSVGNVDVNSSFELTGALNVNSPAVLRMDATDFIDNGTGTSQVINITSGGGLLYGNADGIKTSGTLITDGNIRTSGTRNFSTGANYGFVSNGNMVSGNALPSTVAGLYAYRTNSTDLVTLNNGGTLVSGILGLQNGKIVSSSTQKLTLDVVATSDIKSPANVGGATDMGYENSYVIGSTGHNSATTAEMIFPIGSAAKYGPLALTPFNSTTQTYSCDYISSGFGSYALDPANAPQLDHVSLVEYWNVASTASGSNDDAKVKLFWRAHSQVNGTTPADWNNLRVAHHDGTDWNTEDNSASGANVSGVSVNWGFVASPNFCPNFSPFTIGTITSTNPLPVELTSFTGSCVGDGISEIKWSTASELNSKEYVLQRSADGINFTAIATVKAAGFSSQLINYTVFDSTATGNSNYYRLTQIDNDNTQNNYAFIVVECKEVDGTNIYYNEPEVMLEINSNTDKQVSVNMYEISGKLLHQENKQIVRGYNKFNLGIDKKLANGIYIIQLFDGNKTTSNKLWIH